MWAHDHVQGECFQKVEHITQETWLQEKCKWHSLQTGKKSEHAVLRKPVTGWKWKQLHMCNIYQYFNGVKQRISKRHFPVITKYVFRIVTCWRSNRMGWVKVRDVMHGCQGKFIDPDTVPPSCAVLTPPSPLNPDISEWQEAKFELASKTLPLTKHFKLHWHRDQILLILAHIFIYTHIYICVYVFIHQAIRAFGDLPNASGHDYLYTAEQLKHIIAVLYNAQ